MLKLLEHPARSDAVAAGAWNGDRLRARPLRVRSSRNVSFARTLASRLDAQKAPVDESPRPQSRHVIPSFEISSTGFSKPIA